MMCEHEFVFGRINATHCKRCNDTEQEIILREQLAAANARVVELEQDLILQGRIINGQSEIAKQFEQQLAAAKARMKRMEEAPKVCGLCKDYSHQKVKCFHDHEGYRPPQAKCSYPKAGFRLVDWISLEEKP